MYLVHTICALAALLMAICEGSGGMDIYVRDAAGVHVVELPPGSTVGDLRREVNAQGVSSGSLMFYGRELQDNELLADTGITSEAVVDIRERSVLEQLRALQAVHRVLQEQLQALKEAELRARGMVYLFVYVILINHSTAVRALSINQR